MMAICEASLFPMTAWCGIKCHDAHMLHQLTVIEEARAAVQEFLHNTVLKKLMMICRGRRVDVDDSAMLA